VAATNHSAAAVHMKWVRQARWDQWYECYSFKILSRHTNTNTGPIAIPGPL